MQPLQELIQYLESEKETLTQLINEALAEHDYLGAHHHSEGLYRVNDQLKTLYNIEVSSHDAITVVKWRIEHLRKQLSLNQVDGMAEYYANAIRQEERRLNSLDNSKKAFLDSQQIDDCLYGLISGEILVFKLHLKRAEDFFLAFARSNDKSLTIAFRPLKETDEMQFGWNLPARLKMFGFNIDNDSTSFVSHLQLETAADVLHVKEFLARLVFDCFYFKIFDNPASLEIEWADQ